MFPPDAEYSLNWTASSLSPFACDCYSRLNPVYNWSWFQSRMMRGDVHMRVHALSMRMEKTSSSSNVLRTRAMHICLEEFACLDVALCWSTNAGKAIMILTVSTRRYFSSQWACLTPDVRS